MGVTVKVIEFDFGYPKYPSDIPIGSPVKTTICTETGFCSKAAGITAVSWLLLTTVVPSMVPWPCRLLGSVVQNATLTCRCPVWSKFDPVIVRVASGLPDGTLSGEIEVMEGAEAGAAVTLKGTELDTAARPPSIRSHISTRNSAWTGLVKSIAGTIAVSCELVTKVADSCVSPPLADHSTLLYLGPPAGNENV